MKNCGMLYLIASVFMQARRNHGGCSSPYFVKLDLLLIENSKKLQVGIPQSFVVLLTLQLLALYLLPILHVFNLLRRRLPLRKTIFHKNHISLIWARRNYHYTYHSLTSVVFRKQPLSVVPKNR